METILISKIIILIYCIEIFYVILLTHSSANEYFNEKYSVKYYDEFDEFYPFDNKNEPSFKNLNKNSINDNLNI